MPKPATFIALPMSIDQRKWHLVYSIMLTYFKTVILSVTLQQSVTTYKLLRFRWLHQIVILLVFFGLKILKIADGQFTIVWCRSSCPTSISVFGWCIAEVRRIFPSAKSSAYRCTSQIRTTITHFGRYPKDFLPFSCYFQKQFLSLPRLYSLKQKAISRSG